MQLPLKCQEKVSRLYAELKQGELSKVQKNLTYKYKNETGESKSLIDSKADSLLYAISRMPATYAVIYTLLSQLLEQGLISGIESVLDVGSGTGAGYFAIKEFDDDTQIALFERDENMIKVFETLTDNEVSVQKLDIVRDRLETKADLVMTSYVLSEMKEQDRLNSVLKLLESANKYLLIIDTGTPRTYENMMTVKRFVQEKGYNVIAPCMSKKCGLKNDYCQFYARVERSALMRQAKQSELSYEDEKYFYLLISKENAEICGKRVIRRPIIKPNNVELMLCSGDGASRENFTKKNKELFKQAKKAKINDLIK
ncbi:MAG: hypothetical protein IJA23_01140 [Clostridia bacterium]|nr:hypothetical protein [Clostridia bacterium]